MRRVFVFFASVVLAGAGSGWAGAPVRAVHNVILFIGDGMGDGQVSTATTLLETMSEPVIPSAAVTGLMGTVAANALVTDSAASGTALATGFKTDKGVVGLLGDGSRPVNILEAAHRAGLATGVVTTSGLADATPATFTVHAANRHRYAEILKEELRSPFDVRIGGDFTGYPRARENPGYLETLARAEELVPEGTTVVRTNEGLSGARTPLVALLPPRPANPEQHGPALAAMTRRALELLAADPDGFVVMIETEATDQFGHANDLEGVVGSVAELDQAVGVALEFAASHPGTLVLVTADHDTGGLAIVGGNGPEDVEVAWTTHGHTAQWVPVFAWGPGAHRFTGVFQNSDLPRRLGELLGLQDFPRLIPARETGKPSS
jgi:alkaline phosphatase